ncbi:MAG: methyltransferase family protein [Chthoniobacterales bacterium]
MVSCAGNNCSSPVQILIHSRHPTLDQIPIGVVKQEGHVVIQDGPYRFVRHPAYLAFILLYLGLPLLMGSWFGLLILSIPTSAVFVWLCVVEDNRLALAMGDEYREYIRKRARLIPAVW